MKQALLLIIFICSIFHLNAQTSVLREINTTLSPQDKKQKHIDSTKLDSIPIIDTIALNDSLLKVKKELDSIKIAIQPKTDPVQSVNTVDTAKFQKRIIESRKPLTANRRASEAEWAKEFKISNKIRYSKKHVLDTSYKVFGWHPYWMGNAHKSYNYSLLSYISYFSYEVNPKTGFYDNIYNWRKTTLVDSAKKYDCKVLLTLTNVGTK